MVENSARPDTESRLFAALAHASIVAQGLGILVGIVIYTTQREKSPYAAFQALQAAVYQLVSTVVVIATWFVWGIFYAITWIPLFGQMQTAPDAGPPALFWVGMGSMVIPFGVMVVLGLYGLWGALRAWQGSDFRYALLGPMLERSSIWQNRQQAANVE